MIYKFEKEKKKEKQNFPFYSSMYLFHKWVCGKPTILK